MSTKRAPSVQLNPISFSSVPVNAQDAKSIVSLGIWNVDSDVVDLAFPRDGKSLGTVNDQDRERFSDYRFYATLTPSLKKNLLGNTQWVYEWISLQMVSASSLLPMIQGSFYGSFREVT